MQSKDLYPYMHSVETLVKKGQHLPLSLYEKDQLSAALHSAKEWKRGAAEMFLKKVPQQDKKVRLFFCFHLFVSATNIEVKPKKNTNRTSDWP